MNWKYKIIYLLCRLVKVAPISRSSTPNMFLKSLKFRLIEVILVLLGMITSISLSLVDKVMRARVGNVWRKRRIRKSESRKVITSCETKSLFFLGVMWTHFSTLFFTVVVDVCPLDLQIHNFLFHNSILNADMLLEWEISLFSFKIMSRLLFIESISSDTTYIDVKRQCYTASGWKIYVRIFLNICLCLFVVVVCLSGKILGWCLREIY